MLRGTISRIVRMIVITSLHFHEAGHIERRSVVTRSPAKASIWAISVQAIDTFGWQSAATHLNLSNARRGNWQRAGSHPSMGTCQIREEVVFYRSGIAQCRAGYSITQAWIPTLWPP